MEGGQAAPHRLWQSCSMFLFSELFVSEHLLTSNKEALDLEFPMALPLCLSVTGCVRPPQGSIRPQEREVDTAGVAECR